MEYSQRLSHCERWEVSSYCEYRRSLRSVRLTKSALIVFALLLSSCGGDEVIPGSTGPLTTLGPIETTVSPPSTNAPPATLPQAPKAGLCRSFDDPIASGTVDNREVTETSGIAVSRIHSDTIWMHNDSGGGPFIYASSFGGEDLGTFELDTSTFDWEDMAIGPGPDVGLDYLYLGDIGDNLHFRSSVTVHRIVEPVPDAAGGVVEDVASFNLVYPDPGYDAEAMFIDPVTGDIIVVTKPGSGEPALVFRGPQTELADGAVVQLVQIGSFPLESGTFVTAADITTTGNAIVFRGYNEVWLWERIDLDLADTFATEPCRTPSTAEVQGEAIAFTPNGYTYVTISEGSDPDINVVASIFD